jgi:site-specific DNA-methyltransferase (adenine-specific)
MPASPGWKNKLYFGDNLKWLREGIDDESVDLIYLDPPFNSNANYNVLFTEKSGDRSGAQIEVFEDTWHWGLESEELYHETVLNGGRLSELLQAMRAFLGQSDMMAYIVMMAPRLMELRSVLKPTGSLYLHCDQNASQYLKLLLDAIFGGESFRNDIVWKRKAGRGETNNAAIRFGVSTDSLLFRAKSGDAVASSGFGSLPSE